MRILVCSICLFLVPAWKYIGGGFLCLFIWYLNEDKVLAPFISSGSSFQARMVEGKKELK